jgi:hypothetical protein
MTMCSSLWSGPVGRFHLLAGLLAFASHRLHNGFTKVVSSQWLYMEKRIKTAQVNLRLEPALKEAAEKAAESDRRSLTSLVEKLLVDHLRTTGFLPAPDLPPQPPAKVARKARKALFVAEVERQLHEENGAPPEPRKPRASAGRARQ